MVLLYLFAWVAERMMSLHFAAYRRVPSADPAYTVVMVDVPQPDGVFVEKCVFPSWSQLWVDERGPQLQLCA